MFDINLFLLPLLGFIIGLFVSLLGGGVWIVRPTLILLFGIDTHTAVATSLASVLHTAAQVQ